jgi:glycerophosphoryl diester phosphodiesterase
MSPTAAINSWPLYHSMQGVIAHRGASGEAPENTAPAIRLAHTQGATWAEVDVTISADGIAVIHHDDDLSRCSNGQGLVVQHDLLQLQQLDGGSWFNPQFGGTPILTLHELLQLAQALPLALNLELKPAAGLEAATVHAVAATLAAVEAPPVLLLSSFSELALALAHESLPQLPRALNVDAIPSDWAQRLSQAQATSLHFDADAVDLQRLAEIHQAGIATAAFTVNHTDQASQLWQAGVSAVFSDYPERLRRHWLQWQAAQSR